MDQRGSPHCQRMVEEPNSCLGYNEVSLSSLAQATNSDKDLHIRTQQLNNNANTDSKKENNAGKKIRKKSVKRDMDNSGSLTKGSLRRAFTEQCNTFNIQVLSMDFVPEMSIYQATVSDGTEQTRRCYFSSKSVSRITKNKLVSIKVVDYLVKNDILHINKYYILNKETAVIGHPVSMDGVISDDNGIIPMLPSLHLRVPEDHERLIDDFLRFTGESKSSFEDAKAAAYIMEDTDHVTTFEEMPNKPIHHPQFSLVLSSALEDLTKVRWDHCYTVADYFVSLDSQHVGTSSVFAAERVMLVDSCNPNFRDEAVTTASTTAGEVQGSVYEAVAPNSCLINFEVGAECEL